jgi:hypothetical protein
MKGFWQRFYPWATLRLLLQASRQKIPESSKVSPGLVNKQAKNACCSKDFHEQALHLWKLLWDAHSKVSCERSAVMQNFREEILLNSLGYLPQCKPSSIPDGGMGVFLRIVSTRAEKISDDLVSKSNDYIPQNTIVAIYPGTIYYPGDPIFFVSLWNHYIIRCNNGVFIDGKPNGLSSFIFRSLYRRYFFPGAKYPPCDISWMTLKNNLKCVSLDFHPQILHLTLLN